MIKICFYSSNMISQVLFLVGFITTISGVSRPPGIHLQPSKNIYYKVGESEKLPCDAKGEPRPKYEWTRNEIPFEPSGNEARVVKLPNSGTLVFNKPEDKDEGIFQCIAENEFGRSTSVKVNFRMAKLDQFPILEPVYHKAELGKSLTLNCVPPDSVPSPDVTWVMERRIGGVEVIDFDARVTMDNEYRLRFANIIEEDHIDGRAYSCLVYNSKMRQNVPGPKHYINTYGSPTYVNTGLLWSDQEVRTGLIGQSLKVKCIFYGNPTPEVYWERKNGKTIDLDRVSFRSFKQELVFENLQPEDAGNYECYSEGLNSVRSYRAFTIIVGAVPYWEEEPENVEIGVGGNADFTCRALGNPEPKIKWFINGEALETAMQKDKRLQDPKKFSNPTMDKLSFQNLTLADTMVVQCNASNIHGYVYSDVYLNILEEAPTIIEPPEPVMKSAEGRPVNLTCVTTGKPDPIITWFKNGQQITGGRYQILPSGSLHIPKVVLADAGSFLCQAENVHNVTSAGGTLVVRRKTRIEKMPKSLEVFAGSDAKFTCSGTTDPEEVNNLRIVWLKDGKEITTTDDRMTTNNQDSSLTISGTITRDSGTYTCIATNGLDDDRHAAMLTVKDRPQPPTRVRHDYCDKNATIHWMPGSYNNAPIQYYVLQYNTSKNPDQWNFGLKVNASLVTVNMTLSPGVTYNFRLIAYNKIGASEPSFPSVKPCITKPARPEYHPKNLRTLGFQRGKLYIEWTPVPEIHQNSETGFQYELEILRVGSAESSKISETINDWSIDHFQMDATNIYEPYKITMVSKNSDGPADGDPSTIIGHSYESTPSNRVTPTELSVAKDDNGMELIFDTYVFLEWKFLKSEIGKPNTQIRGEFRGFKVIFWEEGRRPFTARELDLDPDDLQSMPGNVYRARVDKLIPNTRESMTIAVRNNFYIGEPSEEITFRTLPGLPGVVEYFRVINVGDTHVNLEWASPQENRGDLTGYDISYRTVNGLDLGVMQDREPQINDPYTTNAYLSGLSPNSKYRVYIYARTAQGRGEAYFIEIVTAKPGVPRMPRFTIENVGRTYINVSWWINAYADSGTVVYVEYRKMDGPEWLRTTDEVVHTWKNVSNLEPGTKYEIRIKATNGKISVASGIDEVTTDGVAKAYDLIGNIGWFIGMLLSVLFMIGAFVVLVIAYRRGFHFNQMTGPGGVRNEPYSGRYDNTARVDASSDFGPEPKGYSNDYYDDKDYHNYEGDDDGGFNRRPPTYTSDLYRYGGEGNRRSDEYEDFDQRDDRYEKSAPPAAGDYDYRRDDRYDDRQYGDDRYDDRYDDGYGRDDRYDDDYRDDRRERAPSTEKSGHSSTMV